MFWRSVNLTGNQTAQCVRHLAVLFWRSVNLTGNQTYEVVDGLPDGFWRSVNLTGNQTETGFQSRLMSFGAVSI